MPSEDAEPALTTAPSHPFDRPAEPAFGTYEGGLETLDLLPTARRILGRFGAFRAVKRWQWFGLFDPHVAVGAAIVDLGYAGNVFAWVWDRQAREFRFEEQLNLPGPFVDVATTPTVGSTTSFTRGFGVARGPGGWAIEGAWRGLEFDVEIAEQGPPATAICPVRRLPEALHVTQKSGLNAARGTVRWSGTEHRFTDQAFALLDHSHGITNRRTAWRWAMARGADTSGSPVALNAVEGFNEGLENVAWIEGVPRALGRVDFDWERSNPEAPWRLRGEELDLHLTVEGVRSHSVDLGVVASEYDQPIGVWRGQMCGREVEMTGVAEDHRSLW